MPKPIGISLLVLILIRLWLRTRGIVDSFMMDSGSYDQETFEYRVRRSKKHAEQVIVALPLEDRCRFQIHPEGSFDRFAKWLGIAREWQTQDAGYDTDVYIVSDDSRLLEALSRSVEFRQATINAIGRSGGGTLRCSRGRLTIAVEVDSEEADDGVLARRAAARVLPALRAVRRHIRQVSTEAWTAGRDPGVIAQRILFILTSLLGVAGVVAFFSGGSLRLPRQIVFDQVELLALCATVAISAILHVLAMAMMRFGSRTHLVWLDVLLIGIPGAWLTSHAAAISLNQSKDRSEAAAYYVLIEDRYTTRSRRSTNYHLRVSQWPDPRADPHIQVHTSLYDAVAPGQCLLVSWHPGHFGDGWVSAMEPIACPDAMR